MDLLTIENPVYAAFAFYGVLVLLKMIAVAILTTLTRMKTDTYVSKEDVVAFGNKNKQPMVNPDVERARQIHRNDLENIIPFFLIGLLYVLSNPSLPTAALHFQVFFWSRVLHTLFYWWAIRQPARFLSFLTGLFIILSMSVQVLVSLS